MALSVTTVGDINTAKGRIVSAQEKYVMALEKIKTLVTQSEQSWNSVQAKDSREQILKAIDNELTERKEEMQAQINFLTDTARILVESEEEIKNAMV